MADPEPRRRRTAGSFASDPPRRCAHPGCPAEGEYRAPVARPGSAFAPASGPPRWQYFCLEHVRAFNAAWNWFERLSEEEIRQAHAPVPQWEQEVEAFARCAFGPGPDRVEDALGILRWQAARGPGVRRSATGRPLSRADLRALAVLGLPDEATLDDVRRRYRVLVRRYHPDSLGGDRRHEARLQRATEAHDHLRASPALRP